jgi:hypothetical protein
MRPPVSFEFSKGNQGHLLRGVLFWHARRRSLASSVSFKVEGATKAVLICANQNWLLSLAIGAAKVHRSQRWWRKEFQHLFTGYSS